MSDSVLMLGDCLELMKDIPDKSIDLVLTDPPYGTTACKWDSVIPFEPMWAELTRIRKDKAAIALFGTDPFTAALKMSNIKEFKYDWIWNKKKPGGIGFAKYQPMRITEQISIFGENKYYPQMEKRDIPKKSRNYKHSEMNKVSLAAQTKDTIYTEKYPKNILEYSNANQKGKFHPTQKPVALLEYLIKTYTLEGETVLDFTMGSGSTGVAAINLNRQFIGIEKDPGYFKIAEDRITKAGEINEKEI